MIEPQDFPLNGKTFVLTKFPAVAGREIVAKYPVSNMPKLGDYQVSEEIMLKLMSYVGVRLGDSVTMLETRALVDNHCTSGPDGAGWEILAKLEWAMMEHNCSFFGDGRASNFFDAIARTARQWISQTLTDSLAQSSGQAPPPSTN